MPTNGKGTASRVSNTRRRFLRATGGFAGLGFVAGCLGDDAPDTGDPGDDGSQDTSGPDDTDDSDFPEEDILLVIPYSPGGGYDTYARLVQPYLAEELGVDVRVQNVAGGGGVIGTEQVFEADPDGYTIQISNTGTYTEFQITEDVGFDMREASWLGWILAESRVIVAAENSDVHDWDDYVTAVQNEELNFFSTERFSSGTTAAMVPGAISGLYDGENVLNNLVIDPGGGTTTSALTMMERGDVQILATAWGSALVGIEAGISRPIIALTDEDEFLPEPSLPTLATEDVPERESIAPLCTAYRGFNGPPGIPEDRLNVLRDAFEAAVHNDDFIADAEEAGRLVSYGTPEDILSAIETIIDTWDDNRDLLDSLLD